ncbi:hypothetical protein [Paracoccus sp. DMF-8]|uniref:hypothetical protein n=1 Tax=Paracoccus sp. DMF-8 TaxID=3019445 RepID=UPI0032046BCA
MTDDTENTPARKRPGPVLIEVEPDRPARAAAARICRPIRWKPRPMKPRPTATTAAAARRATQRPPGLRPPMHRRSMTAASRCHSRAR